MQIKPLPQNYDSATTEKKWQQHWLSAGTYHFAGDQPRSNSYVIDTPPPTVSGHLHMGHVFSYTHCDFVARYRRMKGMDVFYPMGFDDNGLPTERLVEKVKKIRATDMSREDFIAECLSVSDEARQQFRDLFSTIALSVDWGQEYHTISEHSRRVSQASFLDLLAKGHAERRLSPFFWDPVDQTAIASAEIEDKELESSWNNIRFQVVDLLSGDGLPDDTITIGTTRPELIPACVAIFYHPEDTRYQHLRGKAAITPLFGVRVPILEDDSVEPDKGSGIMMCCTFGDEADIAKWKKHHLPTRVILNKYGKIDLNLALAPAANDPFGEGCFAPGFAWKAEHLEALQGKKVSNRDPKHHGAREIIIELLREAGALIDSTPIRHAVKCAERSGAPLEILPTQQWFVKVADKKEALKQAAAESVWHPHWMRLRVDQWIDGLNADWCISRQRYFGVPFPVWYSKRAGEEGKILIPRMDQLPVNPLTDLPDGYSADEVTPDADVMDTWATSSVSPLISSLGGGELLAQTNSAKEDSFLSPSNNHRHSLLYPADLRPQAHEIIRTWAFYTIVKSHLHHGVAPWHNLMISGWCLAEDKTKMSKSKGNVVTPLELIEQNGTDAVRYWAATSRLGQDTAFSTDLLKIGRKLVTKLWNATKFAAIHFDKLESTPTSAVDDITAGRITQALDIGVLSRLHLAVSKATQAFEAYEYADALRATEDFFWNDLCDNYLELVKKRVYDEAGENKAAQLSAAHTIYHCLHGILTLFAPFVPHITEELYSHLFADGYAANGSIHARGSWPDAATLPNDKAASDAFADAVALLEVIRKAKSERGVSIKYPIEQCVIHPRLASAEAVAEDVAAAGSIETLSFSDIPPAHALKTEDGRYQLSLSFAEKSEVA